jgi:glyoxylase-like metal-dependent hydrolase (beta-lactamase superfamily II)
MTGSAVSKGRQLGDYEVFAVSDGVLHASYDPFVGIERADAIKLLGRPDIGKGSVPIDVNAFLMKKANGDLMLVDAGSGNSMGPTLGHLATNLRAAGFDLGRVTHVLLTHIHPDHANGLSDENNQANFPNAEVIVHDDDARFWIDREADARDPDVVKRLNSAARRAMGPYEGRVRRVKGGDVLPGISIHLQTGHSPGHAAFLVQSNGQSMLFWGDIVHSAGIQLARPEVTLTFDLEPPHAAASRKRVLDWVATDRIRVAGAHLDGDGFGYIVRKGTGYAAESDQ